MELELRLCHCEFFRLQVGKLNNLRLLYLGFIVLELVCNMIDFANLLATHIIIEYLNFLETTISGFFCPSLLYDFPFPHFLVSCFLLKAILLPI